MGRWPEHVEPFGEIGGVDAVDRIMEATARRSLRVYEDTVKPPSVAQVGMVLRALADHTSMMQAVTWAPEPGGFWPEATSVGRWFHAYANACEARALGWDPGPDAAPAPLDPRGAIDAVLALCDLMEKQMQGTAMPAVLTREVRAAIAGPLAVRPTVAPAVDDPGLIELTDEEFAAWREAMGRPTSTATEEER